MGEVSHRSWCSAAAWGQGPTVPGASYGRLHPLASSLQMVKRGRRQNQTTRNWTAGFSPFHKPRATHFGYTVLTHSHIRGISVVYLWQFLQELLQNKEDVHPLEACSTFLCLFCGSISWKLAVGAEQQGRARRMLWASETGGGCQ